MSHFECVVVFDGLLSEEDLKAEQDRIQEVIVKNGGEVTHIDPWGKRHMSYEIKRRREGYYVLFYFNPGPGKVYGELDRFCRISEKVLRHMICHEVKTPPAVGAAEGKPAAGGQEAEAEKGPAPVGEGVTPPEASKEAVSPTVESAAVGKESSEEASAPIKSLDLPIQLEEAHPIETPRQDAPERDAPEA